MKVINEASLEGKLPVYFIGHNAATFDIPVLKEEHARFNAEPLPENSWWIDTLPMCRLVRKSMQEGTSHPVRRNV